MGIVIVISVILQIIIYIDERKIYKDKKKVNKKRDLNGSNQPIITHIPPLRKYYAPLQLFVIRSRTATCYNIVGCYSDWTTVSS